MPDEWRAHRYIQRTAEPAVAGGRSCAAALSLNAGNEMKTRALQTIALLGVNSVVGGLSVAALLLLLFRGDPVLAAVPVVVALPVILAQPWFVLFFCCLPGGPLLAPVLTTAVSIVLYAILDRRGRLDPAKRVLARLRNRRTATVIVGVLPCMAAIGFARYVDFPALRHGIPGTLQCSVKDLDLTIHGSRYYCLGAFIDSEWLWQARLPEQDLDVLAGALRLHPIDRKSVV